MVGRELLTKRSSCTHGQKVMGAVNVCTLSLPSLTTISCHSHHIARILRCGNGPLISCFIRFFAVDTTDKCLPYRQSKIHSLWGVTLIVGFLIKLSSLNYCGTGIGITNFPRAFFHCHHLALEQHFTGALIHNIYTCNYASPIFLRADIYDNKSSQCFALS